jgi:betaine-aldehyde dehydrogenase
VLARVKERITHFKPGIPTDPATTMGAIVSKVQLDRVMSYIASAKQEGARLLAAAARRAIRRCQRLLRRADGVRRREHDHAHRARGDLRPVLGILKWSDEAKMLDEVNMVEYGLTCSIWTNDISTAHRTAAAVEAGFVWINEVGKHFLGVPFGGVKQSGIGARNASRRCSPSRRRRIFTCGCGRRRRPDFRASVGLIPRTARSGCICGCTA